ncbi:MAG TPA: Gfo/Idh/MocA family oxidoreductase [Pseudonocardia sp.]|nr:Gfo/Idh/MocA family oxidoreductase [Pseudonocardia sp.]
MRPIGVGVVSLGWMGGLHSRSYLGVAARYPELGVRPVLVRACDTDRRRMDFARDVLGFERTGPSWQELIDDPGVDVVSICAPNALHREIAVAAAEAGKPFWVEKPVGLHSGQTADVVAAADKAGVVTCVGFNYRHAPAVERLRTLITGGGLGRITGVRCVFLNGQAADPRVALSWRYQREHAGSGVLGDLLSHVADLVVHVTGSRVEQVSAATAIVHGRRPVPAGAGSHFDVVDDPDAPLGEVENEDHAVVLARFAGGAIGTLEVSRVAVGPRCGLTLEVHGTGGSATWDFERMNELRLATTGSGGYVTELADARFGDYPRFQPGPGVAMGFDDLKVIEAARFLGAVIGPEVGGPEAGGNEPRQATVADALAAAQVVDAAVASARNGRWERT